MKRLIDAEKLKSDCRIGTRTGAPARSGTLKAFAVQITEDFCRDIDRQPTIEAIPIEWIRQQAEEFPGMESAMWEKLIRLWEKAQISEELYGGKDK